LIFEIPGYRQSYRHLRVVDVIVDAETGGIVAESLRGELFMWHCNPDAQGQGGIALVAINCLVGWSVC